MNFILFIIYCYFDMNVNSKEFLRKNYFFLKAGGIKLMSLGQIYKQEIINL